MPKTPNGLTVLQQRFVAEYLVDYNGTRAAKRAGYSEKSAHFQAVENMRKPAIKEAIAAAVAQQQKRTLITADQVLLDIQRIGDKAEIANDYAQALRSRELLGKRYKLFIDKVEVTNIKPRAERLRDARARRAKV